MRPSTVVGLLAVAAPVLAQQQYFIEPDSVDQAQRDKWCDDQLVQCPLICLQLPGITDPETPISNECDADQLTYECVCSNNVRPNITEFSQTLPFYICQEWGNQCVTKCGQNNNDCAHDCRANHPCGAQNPKRVNVTSTSRASTASATGDATEIPTAGFAGATNTPKGKGAASSMYNLGQSYGLAVVFAGIFAGFALVL